MREIEYINSVAKSCPTKIALITENNELDFRDLVCMVDILQRKLAAAGVKAGSVVVANTNRAELEILLDLLPGYAGVNIIHADILSVIQAEIDYDFYVGLYPVEQVPTQKTILVSPEWFAKVMDSPLPELKKVSETFGSFTFISSGSTGIPKFIRSNGARRLGQLERINADNPDPLSVNKSDRVMCTLSPIVAWAMGGNILALAAGASVVAVSDHRDRLLQYIDKYRVTHLTTTPVILRRCLDFAGEHTLLSSLRAIVVGGAYAGRDLLAEFHTKFSTPVRVTYGTTEIGGISGATHTPASNHGDGYIGEFFRNDVEIGFFDDEMRQLAGVSEGIVGFKPNDQSLLPEYIGTRNEETNRESLVGNFFFPGDLMRLEDKSLFILGRVKNIINLGGNKISLQAVQSLLDTNFDDCTFACVAYQGEFEVDMLVVFHDSINEFTLNSINDVLKQRFKMLRASEVIQVAKMPLTASGKVDVQKLKREHPFENDGTLAHSNNYRNRN